MQHIQHYKQKTRVRICGLMLQDGKILLVNHAGLNASNEFWHLPGGGIEKDERIQNCLIREIKEETGLNVKVAEFLFMNEFIEGELHAIELFFKCEIISGAIKKGEDPEVQNSILDVAFKEASWIRQLDSFKKGSALDKILSEYAS
jgi:8-oxo-dGTP diphosphatase